MPIKLPPTKGSPPSSPEDLFQRLPGRGQSVKSLWLHQGDLLRSYYGKAVGAADVAMELPTGAGKTLVAMLIAEWRRQVKGERVAYLCPTRQLAQQVSKQAAEYGIPVALLMGPKKEYNPQQQTAYSLAQKIAVTTYSTVFNTAPGINDAQCIILDDAHAAETYIAGLWSLTITRREHGELFRAVVDIVEGALPEAVVHALRDDRATPEVRRRVTKLFQTDLWSRTVKLRDALVVGTAGNKLQYAWSMLDEHLDACNLFVNWHEVVLRPLMPPTETHAPFSRARQRVYLSATLGEGGELERITGIRSIQRLPAAHSWQRSTPGRRFVLLPNLGIGEKEAEQLAWDVAMQTPRALVLCPDHRDADAINRSLQENKVGRKVLKVDDIKQGMGAFLDDDAVLVLTNRYDGIDLPDDACRLLILAGLPDATNLQERFLSSRLGAEAVLRDRVRTRLTQALGRCTRNPNDFATVIFLGGRLTREISLVEFRSGLHPELQVELEVGIENSGKSSREQMLESAAEFLGDEASRAAVNAYIGAEKDKVEKRPGGTAAALLACAPDELEYLYSAWSGEWRRALTSARKVVDSLGGGSDMRPYQAFWSYLVACAAARAAELEGDVALRGTQRDFFERAISASRGNSWFVRLRGRAAAGVVASADELDTVAIEAATTRLLAFPSVGTRFENAIQRLRILLTTTEATKFEQGLQILGQFLGYDASNPSGERAAPDSVWHIDRRLFVVFEAKSDEDPKKQVSPKDARQAGTHGNWVRSNLKPPPEATIIKVLATPQVGVEVSARPHLTDVKYLSVERLVSLVDDAASALRRVRHEAGVLAQEEVRERMLSVMSEARLLPSQLWSDIREFPPA